LIRVLLVGDRPLMRSKAIAGLAREADIHVVGMVDFSLHISTSAAPFAPHVVVINTEYMLSQILPVVAEFTGEVPSCAILVLTDRDRPGMLPPRRRNTKLSVLLRDSSRSLLADAIRRLAAGEQVIDPRLVIANLRSHKLLNTRELEVLGLAAEGAPVAEIANRLYLSLGTVRNYLSSVIRKTGARNRIDAIRISRSEGWLR
jgi:two-component system, NarL family, response regulator DesR